MMNLKRFLPVLAVVSLAVPLAAQSPEEGATTDDHTLYASHTAWQSEADFVAWTKSEAFRMAHAGAGGHGEIYAGHPQLEVFSSVQHIGT